MLKPTKVGRSGYFRKLSRGYSVLPNPDLLVGMFIQKEALLSSQIEGTQSSLVDVLRVEPGNPQTSDVGEVLNYVNAMRHGMQRLEKNEPPIEGKLRVSRIS